MNRLTTKADLLHYLDDTKVQVIAFKGLWGTGKTHLWEEIKGKLTPIDGNDHLYVSCFGLESLDQIKAALFQNSLGRAEETVTTVRKVSGFAIDVLEKVATKLAPGAEGAATLVGSLGGLVQSAMIDKVLHSRLIVLDDIERRANCLQIETLLGFIDLLKRNNCKILMILNEEPLKESQATDWRILKEKCVDREITLMTTSIDASAIGLTEDMPYQAVVTDALNRLNVSNIRVIQRIDRVVRTIFGDTADLPDGMKNSMVPAVVALTALHFNAVPGGPDIAVMIDEWQAWCVQPGYFGDDRREVSDAVSFGLKIQLTNDLKFLELLMQHIITGHRLKEQFDSLFEQRRKQEAANSAENEAIQYIEDTYLDPQMTNEDFIERATRYESQWADLSPDKVNAISNDLERRGAERLAQQIVEKWAQRWIQSPKLWDGNIYPIDMLRPDIQSTITQGNSKLITNPSLVKAVLNVAGGSWSNNDTITINNATVNDIIYTIQTLQKQDFSPFIQFYRGQLQEQSLQKGSGSMFQAGVESFINASRMIVSANQNQRLTELLKIHLGEQVFHQSEVIKDS